MVRTISVVLEVVFFRHRISDSHRVCFAVLCFASLQLSDSRRCRRAIILLTRFHNRSCMLKFHDGKPTDFIPSSQAVSSAFHPSSLWVSQKGYNKYKTKIHPSFNQSMHKIHPNRIKLVRVLYRSEQLAIFVAIVLLSDRCDILPVLVRRTKASTRR